MRKGIIGRPMLKQYDNGKEKWKRRERDRDGKKEKERERKDSVL